MIRIIATSECLGTMRQFIHITKISDRFIPSIIHFFTDESNQCMNRLIRSEHYSLSLLSDTIYFILADDNTYWSWQIRGLASMLTHISIRLVSENEKLI